MTIRRALAPILRAQRAEAARAAVLTNAATRDAKGAVAVVEAQIEAVAGEIPPDLAARLAALEAV